jgi:hypothetical protein
MAPPHGFRSDFLAGNAVSVSTQPSIRATVSRNSRLVAEIAAQLGFTAQTVYNWRNQDQIAACPRGYIDERVGRAVAAVLNSRPRKSLGWRTPAEVLNDDLHSTQQGSVATID